MADKRDLKLDEYGISKHRYRELNNFCLQYPEFIKEKQGCYSLSAVVADDMPRGSGTSNPTANSAERAYRLGRNIELIEQTAIEASGEMYPYILKAVTENVSWEYMNAPCGRRQFYQARRRFFFLLSLKKG